MLFRSIASTGSSTMLMMTSGFHFGWCHTRLMVSMLPASMWKAPKRWCNGDLWCFLLQRALLVCFAIGWFVGRVVIHSVALWQCFWISSIVGSRSAWARRVLVAVVRIPPVTRIAARRWTLLICFAKPHAPHPFSLFPLPFLSRSMPHMLMAYSIFRMATAPYSLFIILPLTRTYLVPFAIAYTAWSL